MDSSNLDIAFVISHKPDIRYQKRIDALKRKYSVGIVYWNKDDKPIDFSYDGVQSFEIHVPANKVNPLKRIPQTLLFLQKAYKKIEQLHPRCLYVGNLDMLMVASRYKNKYRSEKIVYEIADLHRLIVDKQHGVKALVSILLKKSECALAKKIDLLVLTSMKYFDVYYQKLVAREKVIFMPNMPDEDVFTGFDKVPHDQFTVGFVGAIRYKEQLRLLITAGKQTGIKVVFAGSDGEGNQFEKECEKYPFVEYKGEFNYKRDIQNIYSDIDLIYSVYNADMANVRIALPNKLYESVMTGIPIIVAKNTYLAELVEDMGIGVAVNHHDPNELIQCISMLKMKGKEYEDMVNNCNKQKQHQSIKLYNESLLRAISRIWSK